MTATNILSPKQPNLSVDMSAAINNLQSLVVIVIPYSGTFKLADTLGITSLTAYFF